MNKKGHVLIHVLITTIIVVVIATGLAQMLLMRFTASNRAASGVAGRRQDEGSFNAVIALWNANNAVCSGAPAGFICPTCSAGSCGCTVQPTGCTCPTAGSGVTDTGRCPGVLTTSMVSGRCQVQVVSCQ